MNISELSELIISRKSVRQWLDKLVPEELLIKAVELATHAPNGGNQQNWYFYIITNKSVINSIANAVQATSEYIASWPEVAEQPDMVTGMLTRSSFFRNAPAAIAVAAKEYKYSLDAVLMNRPATDQKAVKIREGRGTANARIQSVASATAYLLLVLHQMGLGAVWMTGPMQAKADIEKIIEVPHGMDLVAFIPVGYAAENPMPKLRKRVEEVSHVIR